MECSLESGDCLGLVLGKKEPPTISEAIEVYGYD